MRSNVSIWLSPALLDGKFLQMFSLKKTKKRVGKLVLLILVAQSVYFLAIVRMIEWVSSKEFEDKNPPAIYSKRFTRVKDGTVGIYLRDLSGNTYSLTTDAYLAMETKNELQIDCDVILGLDLFVKNNVAIKCRSEGCALEILD